MDARAIINLKEATELLESKGLWLDWRNGLIIEHKGLECMMEPVHFPLNINNSARIYIIPVCKWVDDKDCDAEFGVEIIGFDINSNSIADPQNFQFEPDARNYNLRRYYLDKLDTYNDPIISAYVFKKKDNGNYIKIVDFDKHIVKETEMFRLATLFHPSPYGLGVIHQFPGLYESCDIVGIEIKEHFKKGDRYE